MYQKPGPPTPNAHVQSVTRRSTARLAPTPRPGPHASPLATSSNEKTRNPTPRRGVGKSPRTPPVSARDIENRSSARKVNNTRVSFHKANLATVDLSYLRLIIRLPALIFTSVPRNNFNTIVNHARSVKFTVLIV